MRRLAHRFVGPGCAMSASSGLAASGKNKARCPQRSTAASARPISLHPPRWTGLRVGEAPDEDSAEDAFQWCRRRDSNSHSFRHYPLKIACLPIPPRRPGTLSQAKPATCTNRWVGSRKRPQNLRGAAHCTDINSNPKCRVFSKRPERFLRPLCAVCRHVTGASIPTRGALAAGPLAGSPPGAPPLLRPHCPEAGICAAPAAEAGCPAAGADAASGAAGICAAAGLAGWSSTLAPGAAAPRISGVER